MNSYFKRAVLAIGLLSGSYLNASGGWHDAGDQLKYLLTSSNATAQMLLAYQLGDKAKFADRFNNFGQPGSNGTADLLDEARWGLEWLRLHPSRISFITRLLTIVIIKASGFRKMQQLIMAGSLSSLRSG